MSVGGNTITQTSGIAAGIGIDGSLSGAVYTSMNNVFLDNTYNLPSLTGNYFYWMGGPTTLASVLADF